MEANYLIVLNNGLLNISRGKDNWINTDTTEEHAYAIGLQYAFPSGQNKDDPIPTIKYDNKYEFPLMRIEGLSSAIRPYSVELIRKSNGWGLRIHAFIDGGIHTLDTTLTLVS